MSVVSMVSFGVKLGSAIGATRGDFPTGAGLVLEINPEDSHMSPHRFIGTGILAVCMGMGISLAELQPAHAASAAAAVSIQADLQAAGKADAALGDKLYAARDYAGALAAYGQGLAKTRDAAFIYAEAQCHKALAHKAEAETMFKMYLGAAAKTKLKYESEARAELGSVKNTAKGVVGGLAGAVTGVAGTVADLGLTLAGGVYGVLKVSVAAEMSAAAKAKAEAGDAAYAAAKYAEAVKRYGEAFVAGEQAVALFAEGEAQAQAGHAAEARALLGGYLQAEAKGKYAEEARQLLLAVGGELAAPTRVAVEGKVAAEAGTEAKTGDVAFKAGQYLSAAKAYAAGYAKKADASLLYAQAMAEFYAGQTAEARAHLNEYLKSPGTLAFKASAEATLKASG